ncbi:MAG: Rne/Rng family ribonuclease [Parvibaculum sp.]
MGNKMLIDAAHREETRVVVVHGNRVEEFDFESEAKKQLRGNIYLAKVTRVEPSLQAAFVEYGGNRHGFLAFNEIHPDYYQIPLADREKLLREWAAEDNLDDEPEAAEAATPAETASDDDADDADGDTEQVNFDDTVEAVGEGDDALEEAQPKRQRTSARTYKIQEVIKRRQIILIQVVKEERGNKGAALTTYLSLAGRYCVLMPNTARGGGISRKITNGADRKRLKTVAEGLDVTDGMGLIVRTAGASRTKAEIKRDYEYLMRLWEKVRDLTLKSIAPALVYEEGSLVKRSIRDLYSKDIDQILVEGDDSYREAKDLMRMLMPSHAKNVQPYKDREPIFQKHGVDAQLDAMFSNTVTLKSGGYIVINQTEALVAIDVNSGRSTKERNIEATALKTNLEAAAEVARQMRLRDLAGLIVIDFIDMDENRNNRAVERKLKEALKNDRARIQVGRISHFGLLEMSRQRMRAGIIEGSTVTCPTCSGSGLVRSVESTALHVLRAVESDAIKGKHDSFTVTVSPEVAIYILNQKRPHLLGIEETYGVSVFVETDRDVHGADHKVEAVQSRGIAKPAQFTVSEASIIEDEEADLAAEEAEIRDEADAELDVVTDATSEDDQPKKKRRRRRRRGRRDENDTDAQDAAAQDNEAADSSDENGDTDSTASETADDAEVSGNDGDLDEEGKPKRRRRRGRRGGRRNRRNGEEGEEIDLEGNADAPAAEDHVTASDEADYAQDADGEAPVLIGYSRNPVIAEPANETVAPAEVDETPEANKIAEANDMVEATEAEAKDVEPETADDAQDEPSGPARTGWWRRNKSAD